MSEEQAIISQTKLFVGGLNWKLRGKDLREEFSKFGEVAFARVKLDKETGKSRGFGFVEFVNPDDAAKAQKEMDGQEIMGRAVKVDFAKENPERMNGEGNGEYQPRTPATPVEAPVEEDENLF